MQESQTFQLPVSQKEVIIRGYVTGFVDQEVNKVLLSGNVASYEVDAKELGNNTSDQLPENGKMVMKTDPTAQLKADNKLLELMIISVDGNAQNPFNDLMQLPVQDVRFITDKVKSLQAASEVSDSEKKD